MSLAIYAAIESKSALLIVMVALSLMVKEDAVLLVVPWACGWRLDAIDDSDCQSSWVRLCGP